MTNDMSLEQYRTHINEVAAIAVAELKKRFGNCFVMTDSVFTLDYYAKQLALIPEEKHAEWWALMCIKETLSELTYEVYRECDANDEAYAANNKEPH